MNRILITRRAEERRTARGVEMAGYYAQFIGPHAAEVVGLFGTDTIPTAFTAAAPAENVRRALAARNPGVEVLLAASAQA